MTRHIRTLKLPALLILSFFLSAHVFAAEEESVIRSGRSSATATADVNASTSNGRRVRQVYLDPEAENNDVSQHLPTATSTSTIGVDERSYLRTSSGEQRRSLSFWSSIMNAIHCGLGHHDHCHHHHDSHGGGGGGGSSNSGSSGSSSSGGSSNGSGGSSSSGNYNNGRSNNNSGSSSNGYYKNGSWYYKNENGYYVTTSNNNNNGSSQYDVYVVTVTENEYGETYYIDENGDTVYVVTVTENEYGETYFIDENGDTVETDYVKTCSDDKGNEFFCITVTTTTEGTRVDANDNSNDDPCWADPNSSRCGKSGTDGFFAPLSVSDNPVINEIVFAGGFIGVATVAGLLYRKRYHQATNSQMQEHMLNGAVGKRRRTFAEVFRKDQKPPSGEQEMSTITRYVQA